MAGEIHHKHENRKPPVDDGCSSSSTDGIDDFTNDALRALAELECHNGDHIGLMLRFGEAVAKAKQAMPHGMFKKWCDAVLKRSPSWITAHRRLYECREDLDRARSWARQIEHKWAHCYSVERLLKVVAEWKRATSGDGPCPRRRRLKAAEVIAKLRQRLAQAEKDFIALRDQLPLEVEAKIKSLASAANFGDDAAEAELAEIARGHHWRLCDLLDRETCSAPEVSSSIEKESTDMRPEGPESTDSCLEELGANYGGDVQIDSTPVGPAVDILVDLGTASLLPKHRPKSDNRFMKAGRPSAEPSESHLLSGMRTETPFSMERFRRNTKRIIIAQKLWRAQ